MRLLRNRRQRTMLQVLVIVLALACSGSAFAWSTSRLQAQVVDSDAFDNYDFGSPSVSSTNVDWPVTLLFYNNANINSIKAGLSWGTPGSTMYGRIKNTGTWFYDADGGRKSGAACFGATNSHYRIYADQPNNDRNWSPSLGYYVIGTTHKDINECGGGTAATGYSEGAEGQVASIAALSWTVYQDNWNMQNYEPARWEGSHYWANSGNATMVRMP